MEAPLFTWPLLVGASLLIVALVGLVIRRGQGAGASPAVPLAVAGAALAWLALMLVLGAMGVFAARPERRPAIPFGLLPPFVAGLLAWWASGSARQIMRRVPQRWLIGIQTVRVLGGVFLVLMLQRRLPPHFALPAGLGDVFIGATAPLVARAAARNGVRARGLAVAWNLLGIADLLTAVTLGVLSSTGPLQHLHGTPPTDLMTHLPLSLIPTFAIPIWLLAHLASISQFVGTAGATNAPPEN